LTIAAKNGYASGHRFLDDHPGNEAILLVLAAERLLL
jgi:hypothetical protein